MSSTYFRYGQRRQTVRLPSWSTVLTFSAMIVTPVNRVAGVTVCDSMFSPSAGSPSLTSDALVTMLSSATTVFRGSAGVGVNEASRPKGQCMIFIAPPTGSRLTRCAAVPDDQPSLPASANP